MRQYLSLLDDILKNGKDKSDRTGTGTRSVFGRQIRFDLAEGFPLITTKKMFTKGIIEELLWFLRGESNIQSLVQKGVNIWNDWPYKHYRLTAVASGFPLASQSEFVNRIKTDNAFASDWGDLGPVYGVQWRKWKSAAGREFDQISDTIAQLKKNPDSRRMIISAWNVADIDEMAKSGLPPCHCLFQFYVDDGKLSCLLYQRSADVFLGVPFNIASYALLTMMFAHVTGLRPGEFIHTFGDVHIYRNHFDQVKEQLSRRANPLPKMLLNPDIKSIFNFKYSDFLLTDYNPHPAIKAPIAI